MNNRLQQFLDLENLTPAKLADTLGVQRSGLSHILSGRNKPGFDFFCKLLTHFPRINAEWLITGNGKPYKDLNGDSTPIPQQIPGQSGSPFQHPGDPTCLQNNYGRNNSQYNKFQQSRFSQGIYSPNEIYSSGNIQGSQDFAYRQNIPNDYFPQEMISPEDADLPILDHPNDISPEESAVMEAANAIHSSDNEDDKGENSTSERPENRINSVTRPAVCKKKKVKRVIIFYSDGSFDELFPRIR